MNNEIVELVEDEKPDHMIGEALPDDAPDWAHVLNSNVLQVMSVMNRTMTLIDAVTREVSPLVDSLSNHPMFKMFGGKR